MRLAQRLVRRHVVEDCNDGSHGALRTPTSPNRSVENMSLPGAGHARCLLTPAIALLYLGLQPRHGWVALAFVLATFLVDAVAEWSPDEQRQPPADRNGRAFDLPLYALFVIQCANLILAAQFVAAAGWATVQAPAALFLTVLSSATAASAAHELIHRTSSIQRWMGRLLLCSILYEHFYTEHLRNHHINAATGDDSASARSGETYLSYIARNLPGQFASAWRLERMRLRKLRGPARNPLRNRVIQGLMLEGAMVGLVLGLFGWGALVFVLVNAVLAVLMVQAVNYCQHWGLERDGSFRASHAWDVANRSNLFSIVGMARHSDHHLNPGRPYHLLRYSDDSPKLPFSLGGMMWLAVFNNRRFRRLMTEELRRAGERAGPDSA